MQKQSLQEIATSEEPGISIKVAPELEVVLPASTLVTVHLGCYFPCPEGPSRLAPEYQIPAIDAPEPDDPFDEVYCAATGREKRRRLQGDDEAVYEPKSHKVPVS